MSLKGNLMVMFDTGKFGAGHDKGTRRSLRIWPSSKNNFHYLENMHGVNSGDEIHTMDDAKRFIYKKHC